MKAALLIFTLVIVSSFETPVENDYRQVFGRDYTWAVNWLRQHDALIEQYASAFNIPEKELKAIVFPELIRYNGLFNAIEIESLRYLYVREGKYYADFSVGYFQMKPSFAEMVEEDGGKLLDKGRFRETGWNNVMGVADTEMSRRERVKRLSNTTQQIIYLCVFYKVCQSRFQDRVFASPAERLKFFATCYNAGYRRSYESLMAFQLKNSFYSYNYSSVSAYYYAKE
jgi:hypothetical protein